VVENLFTLGFIILLGFTYKKYPLSNLSYTLITIYLILHIIGSHYSYSNVPYLNWVYNFGVSKNSYDKMVNYSYGLLVASRNNYDRFVHFSFGLLLSYPIRDMLARYANIKRSWGNVVTFAFIGCFCAVWEILEWLSTSVLNPNAATTFIASQGDIWDSQKDMAVALIGSLISVIGMSFLHKDSDVISG
jgi:putative membrane protein